MSCPRIGDKVRYTHAHKSGTGMVVKVWRKRFYVGWNVLDDQTKKVIVGVPSYGLELLERATIQPRPSGLPTKALEQPSVGQIATALEYISNLEVRR